MNAYVKTDKDNGGVHINCAIPDHAFYYLATALGSPAREEAGHIWCAALTSPALNSTMGFASFAGLTVAVAGRDYGTNSLEASAARESWQAVGVSPRLSKRAAELLDTNRP